MISAETDVSREDPFSKKKNSNNRDFLFKEKSLNDNNNKALSLFKASFYIK